MRNRDLRGAGEGKNSPRHELFFEVGKGFAGKPEGCSAGEAPLRRRVSESRRPLHFYAPEEMRSRDLKEAESRPIAMNVKKARVAQSVERVLGKDEVTSSILVAGSTDIRKRT